MQYEDCANFSWSTSQGHFKPPLLETKRICENLLWGMTARGELKFGWGEEA